MKESITTRCMRTVELTLSDHQMIVDGEMLLVAVSGGPDSMALLDMLQKLASKKHLHLGIAHLNHGLRPGDSELDEALVHQAALDAQLPYFTEIADVPTIQKTHGLSLEEAAREIRYLFLGKIARAHGFTTIALGHHSNDNAELVLMNLLRGSGPLGLAGMPPKRALPDAGTDAKKIQLIRPLLNLTRDEILSYNAENHVPSVTDKTNADTRYIRNRIRCELLPLLRQRYNPNIVDTLNRTAQVLRSEEEWTCRLVTSKFRNHETLDPTGAVWLSKSCIRKAHVAEARRLIRMAIEKAKGNLRRIGFRHIDAVLALASHPGDSGSLDLPDRIRVTVQPERLFFTKERCPLREVPPGRSSEQFKSFAHFLEKPGSILIPELDITVRADILPPDANPDFRNAGHRAAFFDMEAVSFPLTVRNPKPGDRFTPLGTAGRQKIKKYFIDHKVPAARRACCPILESGGRLIWLMGYQMEDNAKITAGTKQVLKVEFSLA